MLRALAALFAVAAPAFAADAERGTLKVTADDATSGIAERAHRPK